MKINDLLNAHGLAPLPMQVCLQNRHAGASTFANPRFAVKSVWLSTRDEPSLCELSLRPLDFGNGSRCIALIGRAIAADSDDAADEDTVSLVYLLNAAEPCVWEAVDSWVEAGFLWVIASDHLQVATSISPPDLEVLNVRDVEGEELESDLLGGELLQLMKDGRMEDELKSRLGIVHPVVYTIVETPMTCKSLEPVDPEEWRVHLEHQANWLRHREITG